MKKERMIHLLSNQKSLEGEDVIDLVTHGTFHGDDQNYEIIYMETDDELKGCETTVKVENAGKNVSITRCGHYESQLILEKNKRHMSSYRTPYGDMLMGIFTKETSSKMKDGIGTLTLEYTIDINSGLVSTSHMTITVQEDN